jgi:hypothetical protein
MFVKMGFPASGHLSMKYWLESRRLPSIFRSEGSRCAFVLRVQQSMSRAKVNILMVGWMILMVWFKLMVTVLPGFEISRPSIQS